jgi:protein-S-isoprenylcysteine O-methyltransferase Ste14
MVVIGKNLNPVTLCWIILLLYWFASSFFVKKSMTKRGPGWIIGRVAVALFVIIFVRYDKSGDLSFFSFIFMSRFSFAIPGSVITMLGFLGALWARVYLGRNWSGYVTYKQDQALVTGGPYRFVRHPIYTSLILMFIGTILYYGSLLVAGIFVVMAIGFVMRTKKEEEIMLRLFGEKYKDYMKSTKRLIPLVY